MKRISLVLLCLLSLFWNASAQVDLEFGSVEATKTNRYVDFKMMRDGNKVPFFGLLADDCKCYEVVNGDTLEMWKMSLHPASSSHICAQSGLASGWSICVTIPTTGRVHRGTMLGE